VQGGIESYKFVDRIKPENKNIRADLPMSFFLHGALESGPGSHIDCRPLISHAIFAVFVKSSLRFDTSYSRFIFRIADATRRF
jgi:hypothetical protein